MRYLITGGAGFIGSHLADVLLQNGDRVVAIDDFSTGRRENIQHLLANPHFQMVRETITNEMVMDRFISECDTVIHLAAAVGVELIVHSPVHTIETNVMGSEIVLRTARRYNKKVLIASTSEIYGKSAETPYQEDADSLMGPTTRHRWAYATSKALDEFLALAYHREYQLPVVVFRLFNTVGPRQSGRYGMVLPRLVQQALANKPLTVYGDGQQSRCFCDVRDVVRAIVGLATTAEAIGKVFNVGSQAEISILQLAQTIKEIIGSESPIRLIPYEQAYEAGFEDMRRRIPDTTRVFQLLGWQSTIPLRQTIQDMIRYFQEQSSGNGDASSSH